MSQSDIRDLKEALKMRSSNRFPFEPTDEYRSFLNKVDQSNLQIPTSEGDCRVYVFSAKEKKTPAPLTVYLHGGGFVIEHAERDVLCAARLAASTGGVVFDIDYRLSPEHRHPVAFNEVYEAMKWIFDNAAEYGGDTDHISMCGFSAGGNLTAAVSIRANETKDFSIRKQFLCYSPLDLATDPGEKGDGTEKGRGGAERARMYNRMYLGGSEGKSPFASPVLAADEQLSGLPDTWVITGGKDVLKTEAHHFASRLIDAGVRVTAKCFPEARHGFIVNCYDTWEEAQQMIIDGITS